jgi:hypothetical protein
MGQRDGRARRAGTLSGLADSDRRVRLVPGEFELQVSRGHPVAAEDSEPRDSEIGDPTFTLASLPVMDSH